MIILSSAINGNADIFITGDKERAGNPPQADFKGLICGNQFDWVHFLKRLTMFIHITIFDFIVEISYDIFCNHIRIISKKVGRIIILEPFASTNLEKNLI